MNTPHSPPAPQPGELDQLLEALCEGELDAEQKRRLEQLVVASEEACRAYLLYLHLHGTLCWDQTVSAKSASQALCAPAPQAVVPVRLWQPPQPVAHRSRWTGLARLGTLVNRPAFFSLCFASSFLFMGLTLLAVLRPGSLVSNPTGSARSAASAAGGTSPAARWIGGVDCVWDSSDSAAAVGEELPRGRVLRLVDGCGEVHFAGGAQLILTGPAALVVDRASRAALHYGRATVRVPRSAQGFVLTTPLAEVVDLGTEFAVAAEPSGHTAVHVFAGAVEISTAAERLTLHRNEAVFLQPGPSPQLTRGAARSDQFVRHLGAAQSRDPQRRLAGWYDGSSDPANPLAAGGLSRWFVYSGPATTMQPWPESGETQPRAIQLIDRGTQLGARIQISRVHSLMDWENAPAEVPYEWTARLMFQPDPSAEASDVPAWVIGFRDEAGQGKAAMLGWYSPSRSSRHETPGLALVADGLRPVLVLRQESLFDGQFHDYRVRKYLDQGTMCIQVYLDGQPQLDPPLLYEALPDDERADHGFGIYGSSPAASCLTVAHIGYWGGRSPWKATVGGKAKPAAGSAPLDAK